MSKSPPREPLYVIDVAKECFDVAEGDLDRAARLFRQIIPDDDGLWQTMLDEYFSRLASKQIKLSVLYRSHLNLDQPALRTKLRAHVVKILRESNPKSYVKGYEGEIELVGVVHSFAIVVTRGPTAIYDTPLTVEDDIHLWVLAGSFDDIDAEISAIGPAEIRRYVRGYVDNVDQVSLSD